MSKQLPPWVVLARFPQLDRTLVRVTSNKGFTTLMARGQVHPHGFFAHTDIFNESGLELVYAVVDAESNPTGALGFVLQTEPGEAGFWLTDVAMTRIHAHKMPLEAGIFQWLLLEACGLEVDWEGSATMSGHLLMTLAIPRPLPDGIYRKFTRTLSQQIGLDRLLHPDLVLAPIDKKRGRSSARKHPTSMFKMKEKKSTVQGKLSSLLERYRHVFKFDDVDPKPILIQSTGPDKPKYVGDYRHLHAGYLNYRFVPTEEDKHSRWGITLEDLETVLGEGRTLIDAMVSAGLFTADWDEWFDANVPDAEPVVPFDSLVLFDALDALNPFLQKSEDLVTFLETMGALHASS